MDDDNKSTPDRNHYFQVGDHVRKKEDSRVRGTIHELHVDPAIGLHKYADIEVAPESLPFVRLTRPPNILTTEVHRLVPDLPTFEEDVVVTVTDHPGHIIAKQGGEVWVAVKVHPRAVRKAE